MRISTVRMAVLIIYVTFCNAQYMYTGLNVTAVSGIYSNFLDALDLLSRVDHGLG